MSRLPQLERLLVEEARRQDRAAGRPRRGRLRLFASVLLALLAGGSVAVAASRLLPEGRPVPAPPQSGSYVHRYTGPSRVLDLRVADPDGGPAWGLRVTRTRPTGGLGCAQVGRVQGDQIGVIGRDGAFGDDGRFHALPKAAIQGCGGLDGNGRMSLQGGGEPVASGLQGWSPATGGCETAGERANRRSGVRAGRAQLRLYEQRGQEAEARAARADLARERVDEATPRPSCADAAQRTVFYGFAGPRAREVTLREEGRSPRTIATGEASSGAYLFVLRGPMGAHGSTRLSTRFASGRVCPSGGPGQRAVTSRACERAAGFTYGRRSARARRREGAPRTATQRAMGRMAARRHRAAKHPLDVPIRGLSLLRFRFVPPLRGLHDYQVQIACTPRSGLAFVTPRLHGGRPATVDVPGPLGDECSLPPKGTVTQAGTGRKIGTFLLPRR
ncbi:hypothetical protein AB0L40_18680 [Patulibacter sp. NPDC049589]|uniref:hypothetical protein n=1 Tax=Patulibacter sp. NPDC049589 TaxID=3154731 RepID=UPI00341D85A4